MLYFFPYMEITLVFREAYGSAKQAVNSGGQDPTNFPMN